MTVNQRNLMILANSAVDDDVIDGAINYYLTQLVFKFLLSLLH